MEVERSGLDDARRNIRQQIREMGESVRQALHDTYDAFNHLDKGRANEIIKADENFNHINQLIHDECLTLIARQQPMASDLREIIADLQIAIELERIADHIADIARIMQMIKPEGMPPVLDIIERIVDHNDEMLIKMLDAFNNRDAERAESIAMMDDEIDHMNEIVVNGVMEFMKSHPGAVSNGTYIIWLVHHLERIGDRITNIGEHILYAKSGTTVDWNRS